LKDVSCIHTGPKFGGRLAFSAGRRAGKTVSMAELFRYPTPFGFCNNGDVAAELQLRQILARDRLTSAREKGWIVEHLKVWE